MYKRVNISKKYCHYVTGVVANISLCTEKEEDKVDHTRSGHCNKNYPNQNLMVSN